MTEIRTAANSFSDCPPAKDIQLTLARQTKTVPRKRTRLNEMVKDRANPRLARMPTTMLTIPKNPPDISAVFAFSGLERNPSTPATMRKTP